MATQLKPTDFALPPRAPRPNIRVAFSATASTLAMRDKLAAVPDADRTLDEIAAAGMNDLSSDFAALFAAQRAAVADYKAHAAGDYKRAEDAFNAAKGTDAEPLAKRAFDVVGKHSDKLAEAWSERDHAICNHPIATANDLRAKLAFMIENQLGEGFDWTVELLGDAERIAAGGTSIVAEQHHQSLSLRALLHERNDLMERLNRDEDAIDENDPAFDRVNEIEGLILSAVATTPEDAIVKLITLAQIDAEGANPPHEFTEQAVVEAHSLLGAGYVHPSGGANGSVNASVRATWQAAWDAHEKALADDVALNARHKEAQAGGTMTDALEQEWDASGTRMGDAEWALFETPAPDVAAVAWKLKMLGQRGLAFDDDITERLVADIDGIEARKGQSCAAGDLTLKATREPDVSWQVRYGALVAARTAQRTYYDAVLMPAFDRYNAVRDTWPANYKTAADPVASAALAAVDFEPLEDRYHGLIMDEHGALCALLLSDAPGQAELATKLELFHAEDAWDFKERDSLFEAMMKDARRLADQVATSNADKPLLDAFAARRREFEQSYDVDMRQEESDAYFDRCDAHEAALHGTPARTIAGVVAKLRTVFLHQTGETWSDLAITDPQHPDFVAGLAEANIFARQAWSAIEDLARIGGVNLAEQGR